MNLHTGEASDAFFGGDVPPIVHALLRQAQTAPAEARTALLWTAQSIAPRCLAVYYALYKHHAGRRELELAERAARRGLVEAAAQAGFEDDGESLAADGPVDFDADGPARFWLFTTKALAFLVLRAGRPDEARELLARIARIGASARVGEEVIASLLRAIDGDGGTGAPGGPA